MAAVEAAAIFAFKALKDSRSPSFASGFCNALQDGLEPTTP